MYDTKEPYQIEHHIHRFAVWAAARASQRGFTSVVVLRDALEQSGIVEFLQEPDALTVGAAQFQELHQEWCRSIVRFLERHHSAATYGRAAKLVAVYLKTRVIIPHPESELARVAHPPVDAILLQNISQSGHIDSPFQREWRRKRWTLLNEASYYSLMSQLRNALGSSEPFWKLERFWTVSDESGG